MKLPHLTETYENWAPFVARVLFGIIFLFSAMGKIPGTSQFAMEVAMTAGAGVPFANVAVIVALILEVVAGASLIIGWQTRTMAFLLAGFVFILAFVFFRDWSNQATMGMFFSCFAEIAGLLYVSVYGAQSVAISKCPLPNGISRTL